MKRKQETNVQCVTRLMNFSEYGALAQMFIMDALWKQADAVARSKPSDYPPNGFVRPQAWIGVAQEIRAALDAHLKLQPRNMPEPKSADAAEAALRG